MLCVSHVRGTRGHVLLMMMAVVPGMEAIARVFHTSLSKVAVGGEGVLNCNAEWKFES